MDKPGLLGVRPKSTFALGSAPRLWSFLVMCSLCGRCVCTVVLRGAVGLVELGGARGSVCSVGG